MMCFRDLPGWLSLSSRVMLLQLLEESSQLMMGCSSGDHHVCDPAGVNRRTWSGVCIAACAVGGVVLLSLVYSRQLWDSLASWRESGAAARACHTGWHRLLRRDRQVPVCTARCPLAKTRCVVLSLCLDACQADLGVTAAG